VDILEEALCIGANMNKIRPCNKTTPILTGDVDRSSTPSTSVLRRSHPRPNAESGSDMEVCSIEEACCGHVSDVEGDVEIRQRLKEPRR
jgi:hypothetical protein